MSSCEPHPFLGHLCQLPSCEGHHSATGLDPWCDTNNPKEHT